MHTLEVEDRVFEEALPDLLKGAQGQWVVIKGSEIKQVLPSYEAALRWAYDAFGLEPFFVKEVAAVEAVAHFSRHIGPCVH
jgi:hypothetical protein